MRFVSVVNRFICCLLFVFFFADTNSARFLRFDQYTVSNGLGSNFINSIEQDSCGHLWVCTDFGLSRFDGKSFHNFTTQNYPSILRNDITFVKSFSDGSIFLGGPQGVLLKYNPFLDTFEDYSPIDFEKTYYKQINGFYDTKENEKIAYTTGGFYKLDQQGRRFTNEFPAYEKYRDCYILSFYQDVYGRYWICSFNKLYIVEQSGELVKEVDLASGLTSMFSSKIMPVSDRRILISCFADILYSFDMDEQGRISDPVQIALPFNNLNGILKDQRGNFWFSTDGSGLWMSEEAPVVGTKFEKIMPSNLPAEGLEKLYFVTETYNGDIWVGSHSAGLWRCSPYKERSILFSEDVRFSKRMASSFTEDEQHNIYVSCDGGGLVKLDSTCAEVEELMEANGLTSRNVVSHMEDKNGHLWLATWGGGILEYDPVSKRYRRERFHGLNSNLSCFSHVNVLSNGEIWVSTGGDGVYMKDTKGEWHRYLLQFSDTEFDMWPSRIIEGKGDERWIATSRSLWWAKGDERRPVLPDFSKSTDHNPMKVIDLVYDEGEYVYVATDRSIIRFSPGATSIDTLSFLPNVSYYSVCFDKKGMLRASTSIGILIIDCTKHTYSKDNIGFTQKGMNYFRIHSSFVASDGRVFFGTKDGFVVQNSEEVTPVIHLKHLKFNNLKISDLDMEQSMQYFDIDQGAILKSVRLPYNMSDISVDVDLVDFSEHSLDLSYRLVNFSDKWIPVPENRKIQFSYIPSGEYQLEVKVEHNGVEIRTIALKISVLPPWWKTWWFTLLCILLIAALVGSFFYIRYRRMKQTQKELEHMVEERTRELDDKNVQIEQQNNELKQVLADKNRVLSVVAHDLKNPMFAIVGALEGWIRRESGMDNAEKRSVISSVLSSSQTLQSEMGRLLEWARADSDKIDFNPSNVDLFSSLNNVSSLLSTLMVKKNLSLDLDVQMQHCLRADNRMISTIFRNFINNAIKFTPEGGKIRVVARERDGVAQVEVSDNGVGMSEEKLKALQDQGYCDSTLGTDNEKGTGLGFRICRDYVKRNAGTLQIQSKEGEGTTISMTFPLSEMLVTDLMATNAGANEPLEKTIDKDVLEGNTVVVVDDDALICQNISNILNTYMEVYTASNGEDALKVIAEHNVDLVLSDVEMPVMNGIELSRRLAHDEKTDAIPFLFLSAKNEQSDRLLGLLSGAIDYIPKPFSVSELMVKVNNILRIRQKQQTRLLQETYYRSSDAPQPPKQEKEEKEEKINPFLTKLMECMEHHYQESEFSMENLASEVGMSQSTLSRRTRTLVGKTPVELMNEYRLNKAMNLLKEGGDSNIAEIAYSVGYSDPAYFTRKFKDFFGILPSSVK